MERTSLITALHICKYEVYNLIQFVGDSNKPEQYSLDTHFIKVPIVLEKAQLKESFEDTDQGPLLFFEVKANVHRECTVHESFKKNRVNAYIETANGEEHMLGNFDYPMSFSYLRDSGSGNEDNRETSLELKLRIPA